MYKKKAEPKFQPAQQPISGGGGGDEVTGVGGAVDWPRLTVAQGRRTVGKLMS